MPFGLSDAGSTFQRMANSIFHDLIQDGVVLVYLNDILIHTPKWEQHIHIMRVVLHRIQKYNLQLQWKKCQWGATTLKFLGFIISATGISMDPAKIKAITDYQQPANVKSLQSFLGLVNFSLRFVPQLATITQLLRFLHTILLVHGLRREFSTNQRNHSRSSPISISGFWQDISPTDERIKYRNWCCFAATRSLRRVANYRLH